MSFPLLSRMLNLWRGLSIFWLLTIASNAFAHEIRPAIADIELRGDAALIELRLTSETLLAGIDARGLSDTNDAPQAAEYDILRALSPEELTETVKAQEAELTSSFTLLAGETPVPLVLEAARVEPAPGDLPRDTFVTLSADLPPDGTPVRFGWAAKNGALIVRQASGDQAYAGFLEAGTLSDPLPRDTVATQSALQVFADYILVGFDHIIPKGLDHILFVLGLFFLSLRLGALITQITVFTVAHTLTLALASLGWVTVSAAIVEPLIAASIVYVALENISLGELRWWRPVLIFAFGLLHGLGFATVLGEFGLAEGNFLAGLLGFNIGVEIGQLSVVALAYLAVGLWFGAKPWYRSAIAIPASIAIAAVGGWWTIERVFL